MRVNTQWQASALELLTSHIERRPTTTETRVAYDLSSTWHAINTASDMAAFVEKTTTHKQFAVESTVIPAIATMWKVCSVQFEMVFMRSGDMSPYPLHPVSQEFPHMKQFQCWSD